jgi:hypothetical protein
VRSWLAVPLGLLAASPATAQAPRGAEFGLAGTLLLAEPGFAGGGALVALRDGRLRLQFTVLTGDAGGWAGRAELAGHYLVTPARVGGVGLYGLAGLALDAGPREAGYLLLGLGLEESPGGRHGWWVEAGVGGGARIAIGWRWRRPGRLGRGQP